MAEPRVVKPRSASGKQQKQALRRPASGEGAQAQRGRSGSAAVQSTQQGWRAERPEPGRCECRAGGVSGEEGDGDTGECQGALQNVLPSVFCLYLSRFLSRFRSRFRSRFVSLSFLSRVVLVALRSPLWWGAVSRRAVLTTALAMTPFGQLDLDLVGDD